VNKGEQFNDNDGCAKSTTIYFRTFDLSCFYLVDFLRIVSTLGGYQRVNYSANNKSVRDPPSESNAIRTTPAGLVGH